MKSGHVHRTVTHIDFLLQTLLHGCTFLQNVLLQRLLVLEQCPLLGYSVETFLPLLRRLLFLLTLLLKLLLLLNPVQHAPDQHATCCSPVAINTIIELPQMATNTIL